MANDPVPLSLSDLDAAADVLIKSFAADPGLLFVLPDGSERARLAPMLAQTMLRFVLRCGAPLRCSGQVRGVALWFPPGAPPPSDEDLAETGMALVPAAIGREAWTRFKLLIDTLDALHTANLPEPHWYLAMLGVDPDWQRRGLGEDLMRPVFEAADRDRVSCYLEAPSRENALYYQRRGFEIVGETDVAGSDVHVWMMRRDPKV